MPIDEALMRERVYQVFVAVDDAIDCLSVHTSHRELLRAQVRTGREQAEARPAMPAVQVPLLVHAALTGVEKPALPVAAACTLLYLGADLYDSILDDELAPFWHTHDLAEVNLVATTLMATLPQISLIRLEDQGTPPAKLWALACLFTDALQTMIAGEYEDLLPATDEDASLKDTRRIVERKSGSANALFARAGAVLASGDRRVVEDYAAFGLYSGAARQLANDLWDIWGASSGRDLSNGKRTFPIVYALSRLSGEQRKRLSELLVVARTSARHHEEIRALLMAAGSVRFTVQVAGLYRQLARAHLSAASPKGSAGRQLRMLLMQTPPLFRPGRRTADKPKREGVAREP